jgi:hypothetical protein
MTNLLRQVIFLQNIKPLTLLSGIRTFFLNIPHPPQKKAPDHRELTSSPYMREPKKAEASFHDLNQE